MARRGEAEPAERQYERQMREWARWQQHEARLRALTSAALDTLEEQLSSKDTDTAARAATTLLRFATGLKAPARPGLSSVTYADPHDQAAAMYAEEALAEAEKEHRSKRAERASK